MTPNTHRVARTVLPHVIVSTVQLRCDHGFGGRPLWFETMVFPATPAGDVKTYLEVDARRYETRDDAEAGHAAMVAEWTHRELLPGDDEA